MTGEKKSLEQALDELAAKSAETEETEAVAGENPEAPGEQQELALENADGAGEGAQSGAGAEGGKQPAQAPAAAPAAQKPGTKPTAVAQERAQGAPRTWSPAMREAWPTLPEAVKDQVLKMEGDFSRYVAKTNAEINRLSKESKEHTEGHRRFLDAIHPHRGRMEAQGLDPVAALGNLLQIDAILASGDQAQKAKAVAQIIRATQVDVPMLAAVLDGKEPEPQAGQQHPTGAVAPAHPQEVKDARVDAMLAAAKKLKADKDRAALEAFLATEPEFIDDVKDHMYRLAGTKGYESLPWEELYDMAVHMNKEVRKVLADRAEAARAEQQKKEAQNELRAQSQRASTSRLAASSVASQPAAPRANGRASLDEAVTAVLQKHSR